MKEKMKILDLFSGLGGFSLGLERTGCFETVAFCDNNKFSKLILDKHWKGTKIYDDIREITKEKFKTDGIESPDIITGGFPCQPFSVAGKQKGTSDDRHLWPEMFRIIKAFKPRFVIGENVRGIINIQDGVVFEAVCTDLESEGYEVQPFIIPAAGVGAPHRRERVWIIATNTDNARDRASQHETNEFGQKTNEGRQGQSQFESSGHSKNVGNSKYNGSFTDKIGRGNEETYGGTEKRQNSSFEFERTSRFKDNGNVSKTENVADTESFRSRETRYSDQEEGSEGSRATQLDGSRGDVADTERQRLEGFNKQSATIGGQDTRTQFGNESSRGSQSRDDANTNSEKLEGFRTEHELREGKEKKQTSRNSWWLVEPNVGRVAHGVSGRVHRLKGLGNSIVPQIAEEIGYALIKAERTK